MKAHVYLDALISMHRLPSTIAKPLDVLSEQVFKNLPKEAVRAILEKFAETQEQDGRAKRKDDEVQQGDIKFVKTKALQQVLICHIIALAVNLANNKELRGSVMSRMLKKGISELKNYIKEVGLSVEPFKNTKLSKDKSEQDDITIYLA